MSRALFVEDDRSLGAFAAERLVIEGLDVECGDTRSCGCGALEHMDLAIVDVSVARRIRFDLAPEIRGCSHTPIMCS